MADPRLLSINQVCMVERWSLRQAVEGFARHGVPAISVWRDKLKEVGPAQGRRMIEDHGLAISGLCFTGLISARDPAEAAKAADDVRRALDEAAAIGAPCVVTLSGGLDPGDKDLPGTRARVLERLAALAPDAKAHGVKIAIEPLHPMSTATRSVLPNLKLANDWCDALGDEDAFGIVVDTYVSWWDPDVAHEIARAGKRISAFHVNDWLVDTADLRLDRGMPGDGVIDIPAFRRMVQDAGYDGFVEVEILSARNWWTRDPDEVTAIIKERFVSAV